MMLWLLVKFGRWRFPRWVLGHFVPSKLFFVDAGVNPMAGSLATIQEAMDLTVAYRGDMIIVARDHIETTIGAITISTPYLKIGGEE